MINEMIKKAKKIKTLSDIINEVKVIDGYNIKPEIQYFSDKEVRIEFGNGYDVFDDNYLEWTVSIDDNKIEFVDKKLFDFKEYRWLYLMWILESNIIIDIDNLEGIEIVDFSD